jgi:hypothetical protein
MPGMVLVSLPAWMVLSADDCRLGIEWISLRPNPLTRDASLQQDVDTVHLSKILAKIDPLTI